MVNIIKEEIEIEESLESKLRVICDFCNTTPTIINGSIRKIYKTNLTYIEPHRIYIKNNLYHFFVDKMWGNKEKRDEYYPVAYELYGKNILDEEQIRGILGTKQRSAEIDRDSKSKDDDMEL